MLNLKSNLRALAICYRIIGAFVALVIYLIAILQLSRWGFGAVAARLVSGWPVLWMLPALVLLLIGATVAVVLFGVASSLQNRKRRVFCLVVAWLMCAFFPLGTVLGVFTILLLTRADAERAFAESALTDANVEVPGTSAETAH